MVGDAAGSNHALGGAGAEGTPGSRRELEEVLEWKIERTFGAPLSEMRVNREQLPPNAQNQVRYLATAVRRSVLEEYESVFRALGWCWPAPACSASANGQ